MMNYENFNLMSFNLWDNEYYTYFIDNKENRLDMIFKVGSFIIDKEDENVTHDKLKNLIQNGLLSNKVSVPMDIILNISEKIFNILQNCTEKYDVSEKFPKILSIDTDINDINFQINLKLHELFINNSLFYLINDIDIQMTDGNFEKEISINRINYDDSPMIEVKYIPDRYSIIEQETLFGDKGIIQNKLENDIEFKNNFNNFIEQISEHIGIYIRKIN